MCISVIAMYARLRTHRPLIYHVVVLGYGRRDCMRLESKGERRAAPARTSVLLFSVTGRAEYSVTQVRREASVFRLGRSHWQGVAVTMLCLSSGYKLPLAHCSGAMPVW